MRSMTLAIAIILTLAACSGGGDQNHSSGHGCVAYYNPYWSAYDSLYLDHSDSRSCDGDFGPGELIETSAVIKYATYTFPNQVFDYATLLICDEYYIGNGNSSHADWECLEGFELADVVFASFNYGYCPENAPALYQGCELVYIDVEYEAGDSPDRGEITLFLKEATSYNPRAVMDITFIAEDDPGGD